jgi:hypothetical protein
LAAVDAAGREEPVGATTVAYTAVTKPAAFTLAAAYPNPATRAATVGFSLPEAGRATLTLFDLAGREVLKPLDRELAAGGHEYEVDVSTLAPGVYVYRLEAGGRATTKRLAVVR